MMPNVGGLPKLAERAVVALERIADALDTLTDRSGEVSEGVRRLADAEDGYCGEVVPDGMLPARFCVRAKGHEGIHA